VTESADLAVIAAVQARRARMREARIWPNGLRYLWTDAFGVVLLVSLWHEVRDDRLLRECEWVVTEVERVLGRPRGIRIGEEPDRDGQYFPYLAMWIFARDRLGAIDSRYPKGPSRSHGPFIPPLSSPGPVSSGRCAKI
jgi:hypothetical protein